MKTAMTIMPVTLATMMLASASPAAAQGPDTNALAATNAALTGSWTGREVFAFAGASEEDVVAVTFAITDDRGLSTAFWTDEFMAMVDADAEGEPVYRFVGDNAPMGSALEGRWTVITEPDVEGNWSRTAVFEGVQVLGGAGDVRHHYEMEGGTLSFTAEARRPGWQDEFETFWTLELTRAQ